MRVYKSLSFVIVLLLAVASCKKSGTGTVTTTTGNNPAPVLMTISPNTVQAGGAAFTLTVTGSGFISGSAIRWNGVSLATNYVSATQISTVVPASYITTAGTAAISVITPAPGGGTGSPVNFIISNTPVSNPLPTLSSIAPATSAAGAAAFTLTVNGTNFINGSVINWNGVSLSTTFISATQLSALVPASNVSLAGNFPITVFTPLPGGGNSNAINFTVNAPVSNPLPTLSNITPATAIAGAAALTLTVNGTNYINGSVVNWNGGALTTTFISATQLTAIVPAANISTAGSFPVTVFSPLPGGGVSNAIPFSVSTASSSGKKFLFDATHAETAGNADWVIDEDGSVPQNIPTPAQSTVTASTPESYWTGALSSWGIALVQTGNTVETLPAGSNITYGNSSNTLDLSHYDVFVVDEPNKVFTAAEKTAILNYVNNGGGLFMVSDHNGSDRDGDGWDSPAIWNDLMTNNTVQANPFGFSIDLASFSDITSNVLTTSSSSPILTGSQGTVTQMEFNNGTTATINTAVNPNVKGLIWKTSTTQNSSNIMSLSSVYGTGRIFFVGDSSPIDDGTGAPGNTLFVSWTNYSHKKLFMNASLWLAKLQ